MAPLGSWETLLGGNEPAHWGVTGGKGRRGSLGLFWKTCASWFPSSLFFILINISHLSSEQGKWSPRSLCILPSWNESVGWVQKSILQDTHKPEHGQWNVIRTASGRVLGGWWSQEQRSSSIIVYRPRLWDSPEKSPIQASITQGSWHLLKVFPLSRISSFFSFHVQNSTHFFLASSWQWNWPWTVTARYSEWSSCIIEEDGVGGFQEVINICQVGKGIFLYPVPIYWAPTMF